MKIVTKTTSPRDAQRAMREIHRQMRFAAMMAVNDTAFEIKREHPKFAESIFDKPVSLTKRAPKVEKAKKSRTWREIQSTVFLDDHLAGGTAPGRYLRAQWKGEERDYKPLEKRLQQTIQYSKKWGPQPMLPPGWQVIPNERIRNAKGNITKGMVQKIMADLQVFHDTMQNRPSAKKGGYFVINPAWDNRGTMPGVYKRRGRQIRNILMFIPRSKINYEKRYFFEEWVQKKAVRKMPLKFRSRLLRAIKTSRL